MSEDKQVLELVKEVLGERQSFRFFNRVLKVKIALFARNRAEAWDVLRSVITPGSLPEYQLDYVELSVNQYINEVERYDY